MKKAFGGKDAAPAPKSKNNELAVAWKQPLGLGAQSTDAAKSVLALLKPVGPALNCHPVMSSEVMAPIFPFVVMLPTRFVKLGSPPWPRSRVML